nr:hypothetical protein 1634Bnrm1_p081 [Cryptomonas sp.]
MTTNSYVEIFELRKRLSGDVKFVYIWKNVKKIFKREKNEALEKIVQKKIYNFLKICLEEYSLKIIIEVTVYSVFYQNFSPKFILLFLNQMIEFCLKYIPFVYLKNNLKIIFKLIEGRSNNQKILPKVNSFLDNFYNAKGNLSVNCKKENSKKPKVFDISRSYENFQIYLENLKNKLDDCKFITSGIIINKFLLEIPIHLDFSKGRICLYEQIIRIVKLGHNFKLILIVYLARLVESFYNRENDNMDFVELYIIIIYLLVLDKSEKSTDFYNNFVCMYVKKYFYEQSKIYELLEFNSNWLKLKYCTFSRAEYLSIFSKQSKHNIFKYIKASYIKFSIFRTSKCYASLFLRQYANLLEVDCRDLEHWVHELINTNKIKAKIDRVIGIIYFNSF